MKILLPIDGSFYSANAIKSVARCLGDLSTQTTVILVNVVTPVLEEVRAELTDYELMDTQLTKVLLSDFYHEESIKLFESAREELKNAPCRVEELTLVGDPAERIAEVAQKLDVDLIVMGSHGKSALRTMIFGSVTEGVLSRTSKPVLLVRGMPIACIENAKVGVAIDASDYDMSIIDFIKHHRGFFGFKTQFSLLHVMEAPPMLHDNTYHCACQQQEIRHQRFHEVIEPSLTAMRQIGFNPKAVCLRGSAAKELANYAKEKQFDLLIMGSHGYGRFHVGVLSSTTLKVAEATDVPLLIIRHS